MADAVPPGASVADIGCGDGHLAEVLRERGHRVVPVERRPGPAARARERLGDCRLGDGLEPLVPGEVQVAVVAGMGGHTIRGILERSPALVAALDRLVLQPQQHADQLAAWTESAGYRVLARREAVDRGRRYTVLVVRPPA